MSAIAESSLKGCDRVSAIAESSPKGYDRVSVKAESSPKCYDRVSAEAGGILQGCSRTKPHTGIGLHGILLEIIPHAEGAITSTRQDSIETLC